jgi:hypothetical protein
MYRRFDGLLIGIKFISPDGSTLLLTELIDNGEYRKNRYVGLQTVTLEKGERIVGIKSGQRGMQDARHHDL